MVTRKMKKVENFKKSRPHGRPYLDESFARAFSKARRSRAAPSSPSAEGEISHTPFSFAKQICSSFAAAPPKKNGESFLVGNSLKLLDKEIIVSYADTSQGHVGYVYQATNFIYTGMSAKFYDYVVKGKEHLHRATYAYSMTVAEMKKEFGEDNVYRVERPRKHRYIYFNADKKRKKELEKKLKYKVFPYPKSTGTATAP